MPFWIAYGYPGCILAVALVGAVTFYLRARHLDRKQGIRNRVDVFGDHTIAPGK